MNYLSLASIKLGVVCPMANVQDSVEAFVSEVLSYCSGFGSVFLFSVLDNYSSDKTLDLLTNMAKKEPRLRVVWAPESRCVVDAYIRGYKEALLSGCDWILEMDAGFSHRPSDMPKFFEQMRKGYDCVFGSRFSEGGSYTENSWQRYFISYGGSLLINLLLGTRLKDMTSGFELFKAGVLQDVLDKGIHSRGHFFQTEIKVHCRNRHIIEVPIHYSKPSANVGPAVLEDAFKHLFRLFCERVHRAFNNIGRGVEKFEESKR